MATASTPSSRLQKLLSPLLVRLDEALDRRHAFLLSLLDPDVKLCGMCSSTASALEQESGAEIPRLRSTASALLSAFYS